MPRHTHSHRKRKMWVENFPTLIFAAKYTVESGAHPRRRDDLNREERKNRYAAVAGLRVLSERKLVGCMRSDWGIRFFNFKPNNTRYTNRTYIRNLFSVFKHRYAITREDVYSKFFFPFSLLALKHARPEGKSEKRPGHTRPMKRNCIAVCEHANAFG